MCQKQVSGLRMQRRLSPWYDKLNFWDKEIHFKAFEIYRTRSIWLVAFYKVFQIVFTHFLVKAKTFFNVLRHLCGC